MEATAAQVTRAALWMLGAVVSFSSMALAGRAVSFELDTFEIMAYRSIIGFAIVVSVLTATGRLHVVKRDRLGLHVVRNLAHFTGQNLWFFAVSVAPLAQVFAVEFTSPIWALFLAGLILKERITGTAVLAAMLGFVGVLIVARPSVETVDAGIIAAALCAIGFGLTAVLTRLLTRHETVSSILFWLTGLQVIFGLVCALIDGQMALPSAGSVPLLILIGCAGLSAHLCLTSALALAPASVVMPIDFLRLPLIAIAGMVIYAEALDGWVFVGGAVIFGANYLNIVRKNRRAPATGAKM
ncbi:DMT family transporter [Pelagovum pacificum]|uniref:DMT family transporter n=1 Tax=Pelagovum pacificum TaxID=2588711 RepID=A0A5C5GBM8_9RHOB|nr:DMT family transporter [Pelagovum pacificum]QQA44837.1 DMT family transporter [Pelagovum pacificum]TNY32058.1 DMT family transporter [Pelagovum pacificum]